ncbi:MAG TPA: alpha-hydroxy acid oxidase [Jatrophihabitans sp.]|nr:alpha-hydroxy acid oxidase [Jatrophihabitans sp.]
MTGDAEFEPLSLADFAERARALLPLGVWDYLDGGSGTENALAANRAALDAVTVYPRVLPGEPADPRIELYGSTLAMPVAVAPMAYQRLLHPDGELAMADATAQAGVPMILSTLSSYSIEEVAKAADQLWFQLYWLRDRELVVELVGRAEQAGCRALVVTVDLPMQGRRLRDVRNAFHLPPDVVAANLHPDGQPAGTDAHRLLPGRSAIAAHTTGLISPSLTWADLAWLRDRTRLPLLVKGILDPDDARQAVELGADGLVVSNHGGRQLDAAPASVDALGPVVAEVAGRCPVLLDSGIRSGTDVLRALALGATAVLLGRPMLWALAAGGADGAGRALQLLAAELTDTLTLAGCRTAAAAGQLRTGRRGAP